ncbi:MAG: ABC transporter ATP-binding protein [Terrimicrobiaceae bacterium]|nr:ABC transporter ATP-binding protein [Terrimicrobiaceae bacterium]
MPAAVSLRNLTRVYPVPLRRERLVAVRDLSLEVREGEVYGLLGPNGCGKSTSLKMLLGLVTPTSGTADVFGHDSRAFAARSEVGFLPENPYFYKFLTGAETLRFYGKLCGLRGAKLKNRIDELLALVGLEDARDRRVGGYSKGMLQRIGLAQAIIQDPRLVVLDEPTAGVDPVGSRQIRDIILDLKARGMTVLLTSHLLEQVQEVCDRVGIMGRGRLLREGDLDELVSVDNQTQFVVENAPAGLAAQIEALVVQTGATLVETRRPQRTLEKVFLEVTRAGESNP